MATRIVKLDEMAREIGDFTKERIQEFKAATVRGVARSIPTLVENSPVDTGQYAASWNMSVGEFNVIIGNYAPHAPIIEFGARPFTPPLAPLLAWAKRVLQDGSQPPDYSPRVWALAIHTRDKISKYGMRPRRIMEQHIPMIIDNIKREFARL